MNNVQALKAILRVLPMFTAWHVLGLSVQVKVVKMFYLTCFLLYFFNFKPMHSSLFGFARVFCSPFYFADPQSEKYIFGTLECPK